MDVEAGNHQFALFEQVAVDRMIKLVFLLAEKMAHSYYHPQYLFLGCIGTYSM